MPTLATIAELAAYTGQTLADTDASAQLALEAATGLVQALTRQTLFYVADDTVMLAGGSTTVELPERPVVGTPLVDALEVPHVCGVLTDELSARFPAPVTVTYSHGWQTIPDDLRHACLSIAARLLVRAQSGGQQITQETVGSYAVSYSRAVVGELAPDERSILKRYRRSSRTAQQ